MKTFFVTNPFQGPAVGTVGSLGIGHLIHNGGGVNQKANNGHIGPGFGGVIEHIGILGLAINQIVDHLFAAFAQRFSGGIQQLGMPYLVLNLGHQGQFAAESGGPGDPGPFGEGADDFRVGVLLDHADQLLAVGRRHPIPGFDFLTADYACFKLREQFGVFGCCFGLFGPNGYISSSVHNNLFKI